MVGPGKIITVTISTSFSLGIVKYTNLDRRQEIISELYNSRELKEALQKMNPPELREDLRQEMFIVICDLNSEKLFELHSRNELRYYAVRIMLNLIQSKTSPFYNKFRKHLLVTVDSDINDFTKHSSLNNEDQNVIGGNPGLYGVLKKTQGCLMDRNTEDYEVLFVQQIARINDKLQNLTWYEQKLFNLYIEKDKNASKLAKETGIPIRSIYHTISLIKNKLK